MYSLTENQKPKTENLKKMAEREGFEPSVSLLDLHAISSRAPSAARASLRRKKFLLFLRSLLQNSFLKEALFVPDKLTPVAQAFQPVQAQVKPAATFCLRLLGYFFPWESIIPLKSIKITCSFPTTQASCPGGNDETSPTIISASEPSSITT